MGYPNSILERVTLAADTNVSRVIERAPNPIRKVNTIAELGSAFVDDKTQSAYLENGAEHQELIKKHINELLSSVFTTENVGFILLGTEHTWLIKRAIKKTKSRLKLPKNSPIRKELETLIDYIAKDMSETLQAFKGYEIATFYTLGSADGTYSGARIPHTDNWTPEHVVLVRTYLGPSTRLLSDNAGTLSVAPQNASTTAHRGGGAYHHAPVLTPGDMRFAFAFLLKPKKKKAEKK